MQGEKILVPFRPWLFKWSHRGKFSLIDAPTVMNVGNDRSDRS